MSLSGRYVIDRLKRAVSSVLKLPVPPYGQPNYWEASYRTLGPNDVIEWARTGLKDLIQYQYKPVPLSSDHLMALGQVRHPKKSVNTSENAGNSTSSAIATSWGETLNVYPKGSVDEPVLILGCGTSKLGEDMVDAKWRGPVIQVDVSSRVCDTMSLRCAPYLPDGSMQIVQDDATLLSSVADSKVNAVIDKGLIDALFCADEYDQVSNCMQAAHRVLAPGGCMVTFSYSRPEFYLTRLLQRQDPQQRRKANVPWHTVEVRLLDYIYLYRFIKHGDTTMPRRTHKKAYR